MSAPMPWGVIPLSVESNRLPSNPPWPKEWADVPMERRSLAVMSEWGKERIPARDLPGRGLEIYGLGVWEPR